MIKIKEMNTTIHNINPELVICIEKHLAKQTYGLYEYTVHFINNKKIYYVSEENMLSTDNQIRTYLLELDPNKFVNKKYITDVAEVSHNELWLYLLNGECLKVNENETNNISKMELIG